MASDGLRERATRFTSLQAAHRGLARSIHPGALAEEREQSRTLLIRLQELAEDVRARGEAVRPDELAPIDRDLDAQAARTRALLLGIELVELRASLPALVDQHRDEIEGLLDVLLTGDLDDAKSIRTIEYLITLLAAEERNGRRVIMLAAAEATETLARVSAARPPGDEEACLVAERVFEDACAALMQGGDVGALRDRVRRYKDELGAAILHPRTLAAAVDYNVTMWNHVAAEIDSSRAIEQLADELFAEAPSEPDPERTPASEAGEEPRPMAPLPGALGRRAFAELVAAFGARVRGEVGTGESAIRLAGGLRQESLRADDVDAFREVPDGEGGVLVQHALVLSLVLRDPTGLRGEIEAHGLDADALASSAEELAERMGALARRDFAASRYAEAFRLSDVRTHALAPYLGGEDETPVRDAARSQGSRRRRRAPRPPSGPRGQLRAFGRWLTGGPVLALALLAAIFAGIIYSDPILDEEPPPPTRSELARISPFLEWGREAENTTPRRFVGRLSGAWDYIETPERRKVAEAIGKHFTEAGIPSVVLMDEQDEVVVRYAHDQVVLLAPRAPAD